MFYVQKTFTIEAAHRLELNYESKCSNLHGHCWKISVYCKSKTLNENGMVFDFMHIKKQIEDKLDHTTLNSVFNFNPTAENIAKWVVDQFECCYRADVYESENNLATYIEEEDD